MNFQYLRMRSGMQVSLDVKLIKFMNGMVLRRMCWENYMLNILKNWSIWRGKLNKRIHESKVEGRRTMWTNNEAGNINQSCH